MILVFLVQGKKVVFVTNNSRKSRRQYSKKFRALGLEVTEVAFDMITLLMIIVLL
jgi:ribonucleotide monophosphatase NagD (HAD superfamily)